MKKYVNSAVLRKDITRFAPLWGLYTVFMVLYLLLEWNSCTAAEFMNNASSTIAMMAVVNLIYAGFCAVTLFGDLFQSRMCNMLHAMPLTREGWFWSHFTSGMLFSLVPNTLGALLTAAFLGQYAYGAFLWLAATALQFLFFYCVAVFSIMCAGNRLGAVAIYAMINFFGSFAGWLIKAFYEVPLTGLPLYSVEFGKISPVYRFASDDYVVTEYDNMTQMTLLKDIPVQPWIHAGAAALTGVVLLVLALLIYRKRHLERAGYLISLKPVTPVFLVIYTLFIGYICFMMGSGAVALITLFVGLAIGFFTGRMLVEKQAAVFRWRNILSFGILVGVFALSYILAWVDPFGVVRYVPQADQVECVYVYAHYNTYLEPEEWEEMGIKYFPQSTWRLQTSEDIQTVLGVHEKALEGRGKKFNGEPLSLEYRMKDGTVVYRTYEIPYGIAEPLRKLIGQPKSVFGTEDPEVLMKKLETITVWPWHEDIPKILITNGGDRKADDWDLKWTVTGSMSEDAYVRGLITAMYADCKAGKLSQSYRQAMIVCGITLECDRGIFHQDSSIWIYEDCENTLNFLKSIPLQ